MDLPAGSVWLKVRSNLTFCVYTRVEKTWAEGRVAMATAPYEATFKREIQGNGLKVVIPGEDNLFDSEAGSADFEAAAIITEEHIEGCADAKGTVADAELRGTGSMKIDWQLYSPIKTQVVARISTSGTSRLEDGTPGGATKLITDAFAANARDLASNAEFRAATSGAKPPADSVVMPGKQDKIALAGSLKTQKMPIADAVGSVVTVLTGSGSGSAFLVSTDGYMLTNAHVVGDEKSVRVRWSDAIETVAEVVRVEKVRDVAIIKTNPRDRTPFALKRGAVSPGARVYAIGSPKGKDYQGTVSSGVISASRIMEGLRYIQSDVPVSHGSSGGTLLDENGAVIGITVAGDDRVDAHGLNFFIPIGDAMDFLNLEQH